MKYGWYIKTAKVDMLANNILLCLRHSLHEFDTLVINRHLASFLSQADFSNAIDISLRSAIKSCIKQQNIALTESQHRCVEYIKYVCNNTDGIQINIQPYPNNNIQIEPNRKETPDQETTQKIAEPSIVPPESDQEQSQIV